MHHHFPLHKGIIAALVFVTTVGLATHVSVRAQSIEDSLGTTPTTTTDNACLARCENLRLSCNASAAGIDELLARCEVTVTSPCVEACRAGSTFTPPPFPTPADLTPAPVTEPTVTEPTKTEERTDAEEAKEPETPRCEKDEWTCGNWGSCSDKGQQTRECKMTVDCVTATSERPAMQRSCTPTRVTEPVKPAITEPTREKEPVREEPKDEEQTREDASATEPKDEEIGEEPSSPETTKREEVRKLIEDFRETVTELTEIERPLNLRDAAPAEIVSGAETICQAGSIPADTCRELMKRALGYEDCALAGIVTRPSCERYLTSRNGGVFPGCEAIDILQCDAAKDVLLAAYMPEEEKTQADALIAVMREADTIEPVPGITSFRAGRSEEVLWWRSTKDEGAETSSGVVMFDADGDGLPNEFESANGLDPNNPDTDGDGTNDKEQLDRSSDIRGRDSTAVAIIKGMPFEQPRGKGAVDETLRADVQDQGLRASVSGTCDPSATCLLFIYSYVPTVFAVTADANGQFTYEISDSVTDGAHVAYVAVMDDTGRVSRKSNPLSFFVQEAQAADNPDAFLGLDPIVEAAQPESAIRWYVISALLMIAGALIIGFLIIKPKRAVTGSSDVMPPEPPAPPAPPAA